MNRKHAPLNEGDVFCRLTLRELIPPSPGRHHSHWLCQCACGSTTLVTATRLRTGETRSCGCLRKELAAKSHTTHGESLDPLYSTWLGMRGRCNNPKFRSYKWYGARGIKVDPAWDDFAAFKRDVGPRPGPQYTLDRRDNDGPYAPWNVRWATPGEQRMNQRPRGVAHG